MLEVNEGKEVDGEGAQSLHNIWLEGETENTPGQAGTASPGIPNMPAISMDSSNTTEVVNIGYVASEEQIFQVSLAVIKCCINYQARDQKPDSRYEEAG